MDTIVAVSSGRPPAAIAIVRVSGAAAGAAVRALSGPLPEPRRATLRALRDAAGGLLDRALVLWFPAPESATGEDVAEFHVHGGRAVIEAVERAIRAVTGVRGAEPGEFTRRALINGRIDLAQAEGLADLLAAETEAQRRAAMASAEGIVGREVRGWLDRLSAVRATIEAMIDFEDEGDVPQNRDLFAIPLRALVAELGEVLARPTVERLNQGFRVVIAGPPNAGKSSLFNALLQRDAAIVTPIAGTTRDRIEGGAARQGLAFAISDTAGLAVSTDDPIEAAGIERSRAAMVEADVILWLSDDAPDERARSIWLRGQCDRRGRAAVLPGQDLAVSAFDVATIEALWRSIEGKARAAGTDPPYLLHRHQRDLIESAMQHCCDAARSKDVLAIAEDLRVAAVTLAKLVGVDANEAMLDTLFGRFCIGK